MLNLWISSCKLCVSFNVMLLVMGVIYRQELTLRRRGSTLLQRCPN